MAAAGLPVRPAGVAVGGGRRAVPVVAMWAVRLLPAQRPGHHPPTRDVADRVEALTTPDERIFVWGEYPEIYWAANREPATRFIHTGFLTGNSGGRDAAAGSRPTACPAAWDFLAADMAATPPDLIVDTSAASIRKSDRHPLEETFLWDDVVRDYRLVDVVDGVRLYLRNGATP